ncbi:hypothetical protein Goarm_005420 [Gossypium armourianum]|uniref:RNA polymerase Rpb4/RPC9 core domain-containing protein n=1 Tax=Gossypium armourianum TaxID=34283 RepID=A0A7J9JZV4_9ROSI|nr:hypothetical protein [Gossypium armourianum]
MSEKGGRMFSLPTKTTPKSSLKSTADPTLSVFFLLLGSPDVNFSSPKSDGKFATPFGKELPENVKCLMDCEAASILEGIQDQMVILSSDPTIKLPESFGSGLQYAKTGSYYTNPQSICVIANTCPETVDEVFALVRSLEAKRSKLAGPLKDVLDELAKLKTST